MKIIGLVSENFKGIKAINITPDANFQIISGKNEQGKTSVLDSIWAAIQGKEALKDTDKPIRNGEEKAFVTVDLDELRVTRRWKGDSSTLEVTAKDGAKYNSPQGMLDNLIGKLSFDPISFSTMEDKKQKAALQELVGINFDKLDQERKGWYEERTFNNVSAKKLEGALSELKRPVDGTPAEEVSASDIIKELTAAQGQINLNSRKRQELENLRQSSTGITSEIKELEERLTRKKTELAAIQVDGLALKAEVESLSDPDTIAIQRKLQDVEGINASVRAAKEFKRLEDEIKSFKDASAFLTNKIEEIDKLKLDTLQSAVFPIEGLGFDEDGITFNDVPFKQCSDAQQLKISVATAMALNPKIKVIRMKNGSLLDSGNLAMIHEMAKEHDYQVWIEIVNEDGNMGVVIEDGMVKQNLKEVV